MIQQIDVIGQTLGNFGKWQLRTMLIVFLCKIPTSWFMAVIIFTAPIPKPGDFWCKPPINLTADDKHHWLEMAHPVKISEGHTPKTDYCHVYRDIYEHPKKFLGINSMKLTNLTKIKCPKNEFEYAKDYQSLVADFTMICGHDILLPITQMFHILGLCLGAIVAFNLLKYLSPKRVMLIGMICQITFGILTGAIKIYWFHVLFRCLTAVSCALMYTSGTMILVDITNGSAKTIITILFELFWSIGLILLPVFYVFITDPLGLYIGISTPTVIMIYFYRWVPDSPRWLLRFGYLEEAKEIIIEGGTKNKNEIPEDIDNLLKQQAEDMHQEPLIASWWSIWDGKPKKRYLLACHLAWSVYISLFNSVILSIRVYGRDHLQVNTVAVAFSEIIGVFVGMYLILFTRRRWLWSGLISIATGCLAYFTWFIPDTLQETHVVALAMLPTMGIKLGTSAALALLTICSADLVSVEKKKILTLSVTVWARAGFLWAPFVFMLRIYDSVLPLTVFATLSVIGGCLTCIVNTEFHIKAKRKQRNENIQSIIMDESKNVSWANRFSKNSYDVKPLDISEQRENRFRRFYSYTQNIDQSSNP